ncbi:MAG: hypothetical protein ACXWK8_13025 [Myxococcaceae bacterium]|jgi:hypothetical protein
MEQLSDNLELATVTRDEDMWILRVEANGKVQEYRCNSEVQARALAILLLPSSEQQLPTDPSPALS